MPKSTVDNSTVEHAPTPTVAISSDSQVEIASTPKSFRLKDNSKSTPAKKTGCC